jgi:hypothetical protein
MGDQNEKHGKHRWRTINFENNRVIDFKFLWNDGIERWEIRVKNTANISDVP